jgi:Mce-associated membrane protein
MTSPHTPSTPRSPRSRRRIAGERRTLRPDDLAAPGGPVGTGTRPEWLDSAEPTPAPVTATAAGTATATTGTDRREGPSWAVVTALAVLAVLLATTAAVLGLRTWDVRTVREHAAVDEASRTAPAAAERAAAAILAYDYRTLSADEKAAERYLTPSYRRQYARTFDRLVRPNATKLRARVAARVKASGVSHADPHRVNVLLYVNQTTTSAANGGEPQLALNRVQLSMVQAGSRWLVDDITSY